MSGTDPYEPPAPPADGDEAPPDTPSAGEDVCPECEGSGRQDGAPCPACQGTGRVIRVVGGG
jgi:hypothetical protein